MLGSPLLRGSPILCRPCCHLRVRVWILGNVMFKRVQQPEKQQLLAAAFAADAVVPGGRKFSEGPRPDAEVTAHRLHKIPEVMTAAKHLLIMRLILSSMAQHRLLMFAPACRACRAMQLCHLLSVDHKLRVNNRRCRQVRRPKPSTEPGGPAACRQRHPPQSPGRGPAGAGVLPAARARIAERNVSAEA